MKILLILLFLITTPLYLFALPDNTFTYYNFPQTAGGIPKESCALQGDRINNGSITNYNNFATTNYFVPSNDSIDINCDNGYFYGIKSNPSADTIVDVSSGNILQTFKLYCNNGNFVINKLPGTQTTGACVIVCNLKNISQTMYKTDNGLYPTYTKLDGGVVNGDFVTNGATVKVTCPNGYGVTETGVDFFTVKCNDTSFVENDYKLDYVLTQNKDNIYTANTKNTVINPTYRCRPQYKPCNISDITANQSTLGLSNDLKYNGTKNTLSSSANYIRHLDYIVTSCKNKDFKNEVIQYTFLCKDGSLTPAFNTNNIICPG